MTERREFQAAREGCLVDKGQFLALSTTPIAGSLSRGVSIAWTPLTEAILVVLVIVALVPRFAALGIQENGRDGRFAEAIISVRGLPDPVLPSLCASHGALAEAVVRARLCGSTRSFSREHVDGMPSIVATATATAQQAFLAPLQDAQARVCRASATGARRSGRRARARRRRASHRCRHRAFHQALLDRCRQWRRGASAVVRVRARRCGARGRTTIFGPGPRSRRRECIAAARRRARRRARHDAVGQRRDAARGARQPAPRLRRSRSAPPPCPQPRY